MTEHWRKSSHSGGPSDPACVELAELPEGIGIRDSKNPHHGRLTLPPAAFGTLVRQIKEDALDHPS
ncbi:MULTISPECIES: DUF397 domain-containing protein [Thermomonospora]|uniref:DUF397 domain-containing protein n=1 Tax=Thermomonospora cellulosilytica TaxID=1411118 RepID=A0A7W3MUW8_9ACTN|nr:MULTISPECIES: DUF397 domain-containing protein [Thermomonospora]MBA9002298.1 hypothetical protein [Thermomonospora cellulosilytica]